MIVFPKGVNDTAKLASLKCDVIGIDWTKDIAEAKAQAGGKGNSGKSRPMCPVCTEGKDPPGNRTRSWNATAAARDTFLISATAFCRTTPPENAKYLVDCVKELSIKYHERAVSAMNSNTIDFDVLKRFNQQGPRYTSYPTAPMFSPEFTNEDFRNEIVDTNEDNDRPLSLYFHFPFCAKLCYFCGCTMRVTHDRKLISSIQRLHQKRDRLDRSAGFKTPKGRADALGRRNAVISFAGRDPRDRQLY